MEADGRKKISFGGAGDEGKVRRLGKAAEDVVPEEDLGASWSCTSEQWREKAGSALGHVCLFPILPASYCTYLFREAILKSDVMAMWACDQSLNLWLES